MTQIQKLRYLLAPDQKKQLGVLSGLLVIGMLFEMAGLSILIPILGLMLEPNIGKEYPALQPYLQMIGNPSHMQLVFGGMAFLLLIYLIKALYMIFLGWRQSKFSAELQADLSKRLFLGYLRQPYMFHLTRNSAQLMRNIQQEIGQFSAVTQAGINLILEFAVIIGIAAILVVAEPLGALIVTTFLTLTALGFHRLTRNKLLAWGETRQRTAGYINQHLLQGLGGVKDIKLMGRENEFLEEYSVHNDSYAKIQVKTLTLSQAPRFYLEFLAVVGLVGLIISMILQNKPMDLVLPTVGIFVAAAFRMIPSLNRIMNSVQTIRYSQSTVDVLYEEFHAISHTEFKARPSKPLSFGESVVINNLSFSYPNTSNKALDNINLKIKKGESIGFIGPSGSGKSTLVDIILGLLEPSDGNILIDSEEMQDTLRSWQDHIGYVPQSIYLTDDTLRRNIAFGIPEHEINNAAVENALKAAQLDEFVENLPEGLESFVGERGVRLSGGQRQRIGIARALYHDPEVLVLDEATSALDTKTEKGVMDAVSKLKGDKTLIIIAHRLSTVENCNYLYRLEKGFIVEQGSPKQILLTKQA